MRRRRGAVQVIVELEAPPEAVVQACREVLHVTEVAADAADGWCRATLTCADGTDIRADVFRLATGRGWVLRELRQERNTLEDVFVELTGEGTAG